MGSLAGIFAAAATPLKADHSIDIDRLVQHCRWLLDEGGCDGVNLLGTTGEATSFSVEQRLDAMRAVAESDLPMERFMVGTGAAALSDAVRLTSAARELGFSGALLLPPFYYKNIEDESVYAYVAEVIERAAGGKLGIYLYHIPQFSAVPFSIPVVERLAAHFPGVLAGIKDFERRVRECHGDGAAPSKDGLRVSGIRKFPRPCARSGVRRLHFGDHQC